MRVSEELSELMRMAERENRDPRAVTVITTITYSLFRQECVKRTSDGMGVQLTDKGRNKVAQFDNLLEAAVKAAEQGREIL